MNTSGCKNTSARDAAKKLVEILLQRWVHHGKDHAQLCTYNDGITEMVKECGEARMQAAVKAARTRCHFLPEPDELRELLPSPDPSLQHSDPNCPDCRGNGWRMVDVPANQRQLELHPDQKTVRRAQRCPCKPPAALNGLEVDYARS